MKHLVFASCLSLLMLSGCGGGGDADPPGQLQVTWNLSTFNCTELGISVVRAFVYDNDGSLINERSVACNVREAYFPNLEPGLYSVEIQGFRGQGTFPEYRGESADAVEVSSGRTALVDIGLQLNPGAIDLTWKIHDGTLCGFAGVDTVRVDVTHVSSLETLSADFPCDPLGARMASEAQDPRNQTLDDSTRGVVFQDLAAGQWRVRAHALQSLSSQSLLLYAGQSDSLVQHGQVTPVDIVLSPCDGSIQNSACGQ